MPSAAPGVSMQFTGQADLWHPAGTDTRLDQLARALGTRGFAVQRVADMEGWLAYHAAFVACVAAALYRCGTDPGRLAADRPALRLMCAAVTEPSLPCATWV